MEDKVGWWRVFHGINRPQMLNISEQISNNGAYMGVRRRVVYEDRSQADW